MCCFTVWFYRVLAVLLRYLLLLVLHTYTEHLTDVIFFRYCFSLVCCLQLVQCAFGAKCLILQVSYFALAISCVKNAFPQCI